MADDELIEAFVEESRDNLDQLDRDLVELEVRPEDVELLARVYRTFHTIKGTCGFLGFERLELLTHAGEDLLGALRAGDLRFDGAITTSLLALVDATRASLACIDATGEEPGHDGSEGDLVASLRAHLVPTESGAPSAVGEAACTAPVPVGAAGAPVAATRPPAHVAGAPGASGASGATGGTADGADGSVRVEVAVLDKLMDLVGELVLARTQLATSLPDGADGPLARSVRQLHLLSTELQDSVMRARLQPVGTVTGKVPRIVRDLARALGKRVHVELDGEDVGVDKAVNEVLRDPLLHLVRNAVDHGIEAPDVRVAAGKRPEGRLCITASHRGGQAVVEVTDDGRGIDPVRVVASAIGAGLITSEVARDLSPAEALDLVFLPGLSTKSEVTTVSGRGVGMDVVRSNLDRVGGRIEIDSAVGRGTRFRLSVPLTLAVMPTVQVRSGGQRYAIPQICVREVVVLAPGRDSSAVTEMGGARSCRVRDRFLPLVDLADHLGAAPVSGEGVGTTVVVMDVAGRHFGLVVDGVDGTADAVVKPLTLATRSIPLFAGVTTVADGRPALILDADGLADAGRIALPLDEAAAVGPSGPPREARGPDALIATALDGGTIGVELADVIRIEQLGGPIDRQEVGAGVRHHRGGLLRVVATSIGGAAGRGSDGGTSVTMIICRSASGPIGLLVSAIDDIVHDLVLPPQLPTRPGVAARAVLDGRVVDVLDIDALAAGATDGRAVADAADVALGA